MRKKTEISEPEISLTFPFNHPIYPLYTPLAKLSSKMTEARRTGRGLVVSLPFSGHQSTTSVASITLEENKLNTSHLTTPWIREGVYGQSLGLRTRCHDGIGPDAAFNGPPDLLHWGKYYGSRSSVYTNNDFDIEHLSKESGRKDDDGYVGFYHFANGLTFHSKMRSIEDHLCEIVGLAKEVDGYHWKKDINEEGSMGNFKKDMILTYCTYNVFNKCDFRVKYIITTASSLKKVPVSISQTYTIIPNIIEGKTRKNYTFNLQTISQLSSNFWEELNASSIIRLFHQLDYPSNQLTGLVSYPDFTNSKQSLENSMKTVIKFLPKGHLTETKSCHGVSTGSGNVHDGNRKVNNYRNTLVDTIIRLVELDISGELGTIAINEIKRKFYYLSDSNDWDIIILRILKAQMGGNHEHEYLTLIHSHMQANIEKSTFHSTQLALILIEQVKFLISKERYDLAIKIAQTAVNILPLDFDCWYYLALCCILNRDIKRALIVINLIPVVVNSKHRKTDIGVVLGINDLFMTTFASRVGRYDEVISEATFKSYFPPPVEVPSSKSSEAGPPAKSSETGSIKKLWHDYFTHNPLKRHPIIGNMFYQSPLVNSLAREIASVDHNLLKLADVGSAKASFSAQSAGTPTVSILEFDRVSTWGRCYDLLSLLIAIQGWDSVVRLKEEIFQKPPLMEEGKEIVVNNDEKGNLLSCEMWLDQLFLILYEDLKVLMVKGQNNVHEQHHSALEWEIMGILGLAAKYNLQESITSIMTSSMGLAEEGKIDYFGIIKLLEIYDEFILSEVNVSHLDLYGDDYLNRIFSNKLILRKLSPKIFENFVKTLENEYLTLDIVLYNLIILISWNLRWYNYSPSHLIVKILSKLCLKYDSVFVRGKFRIIFEQHRAAPNKPKSGFMNILGKSKTKVSFAMDFSETDTIVEYIDRLITWIEDLKQI